MEMLEAIHQMRNEQLEVLRASKQLQADTLQIEDTILCQLSVNWCIGSLHTIARM